MLRCIDLSHRLSYPGRVRRAILVPGLIVGLGLAVGGCSADFLRFDAPAFSLNGDTSKADADVAVAPAGSTLYEQRRASVPEDDGDVGSNSDYAPVAGVSRSQPSEPAARRVRVASNVPAVAAPDRSEPRTYSNNLPVSKPYAPSTTGALPAAGDITVQPGDTLYQLSRRHGVSVAALREANRLVGNVIKPGQTLVLPGASTQPNRAEAAPRRFAAAAPANPVRTPAPRYQRSTASDSSYTVRPGDSLYAIARRTGTSVAELKRLNGIINERTIRPGRRLSLAGRPAPATASARSPEPSARVASRTDYGQGSTITAKPIKTLPIIRTKAAPDQADINQPRILNQRPETPIATKPPQKIAALPAVAADTKFRWPARGRVIANFNHTGNGVKNDGINIALPEGTEIGAAENGVVAYAGSELKGYGNLVLVRHDSGWVSAYAHASEILVKRGDRITRGQTIARAGRSGEVTQPQLHFELRKGAKPVDPIPHMAAM